MSNEQTDFNMVNDMRAALANRINTPLYINNNGDNIKMETTHITPAIEAPAFPAPTTPPVDVAINFKALTGGMRNEAGKLAVPVYDGYEALALGGADFNVEYRSLEEISGGELTSPAAKHNGFVFRTDTNAPLGRSVTTRYSVQQNDVLAEIGNHVIRSFGGHYSNVIMRGAGDDIGLTVELPESTYIANGRKLVSKLTLLKGHGGVRNIVAVAHGFDLFCTNQIVSMLKNGETITTIAHTSSANLKLSTVHDKVMTVLNHEDEWNKALVALGHETARITPTLDAVFGQYPNTSKAKSETAANGIVRRWEERRDRVIAEYEKDFNDDIRGTKLGVLFAFQGSEEHIDGRGNPRSEQAKIGRFVNQTQPDAEKAYAVLTA